MAKRKDLLLNESTISRMMGLAGIGSLANPFLKEEYSNKVTDPRREAEQSVQEGYDEEMDEGHDSMEELDETYDEMEELEEGEEEELEEGYHEDEMEELEEGEEDDEEEELEEAKEACKKCGKVHEGSCKGYMQESIRSSMKRLKTLLEQADAGEELPPAPAPKGDEMPPEPAPGGVGDDEMEAKIKEFVRKLGDLVQETLGVEVTVEEGEGEPEMPEAEATPPAPMAEAVNRLVNKVARRVKARLMEAKGGKDKAIETKRKMDAKKKKEMQMKALKEKQAASKKKEAEAAKKKKEMEMKKKKAAMAKKK